MNRTSVKISSVVKYQLPEFIRIEYPLVENLLQEYYNSLESSFAPYDIIKNLSEYIKIDSLTHLGNDFVLYSDINDYTSEIVIYSLTNNLRSLPTQLGFIQVDDEIILYKNRSTFDESGNNLTLTVDGREYFGVRLINCARGFSGITELNENNVEDELVFTESNATFHKSGTKISNLSIKFFDEFLKKIRYQLLPGFENRSLAENLNQSVFIKQSRNFYQSKGSDGSFKILFRALFDKDVKVIKPSEFVIEPSVSQYQVVRYSVVEAIEGDPLQLLNRTLFQDKVNNIPSAKGTVSYVEKIFRDGKEYYVISIDDGYERDINYRGTTFSYFSIHPKTTVTTPILVGDTYIDVDSTVSFPESGTLIIYTQVFGSEKVATKISYESKSLTQFFGCKTEGFNSIQIEFNSGVEIYDDSYAYGFLDPKTQEKIKIRLTGILSEFETPKNTFLYKDNDEIRIKNLGFDSKNSKDNNWIFNIPLTYDIFDAEEENISTKEYTIIFKDSHNFVKSDIFSVDNVPGLFLSVISIPSKFSLVVRFFRPDQTEFSLVLQQIKGYRITKEVSKARIKNYPELNIFSSNIQNTYLDEENTLYVTSQSLPAYSDRASGGNIELDVTDGSLSGNFLFGKQTLNDQTPSDRTFLFEGQELIDYEYFTIFDENGPVKHGFFTGDAVVFRCLGENPPIPDGVYFVKEFKSTNELSSPYGLKLSKSRSNLINRQYVSAEKTNITSPCVLQYFDSSIIDPESESNYLPKKLDSQRLIRKISNPSNTTRKEKTNPGPTGIFVNGVELYNYKSKDYVYFGGIESIDVTAGGQGYDIINKASVTISDFGGSLVNYDSTGGVALESNGQFLLFGASGGSQLYINQTGGSSLNISGNTLNLGSNEVTYNGLGGVPLRVNGALVTLGGVGGTRLYTGGSGGIPVIINGDKLTVGNVGRDAKVYASIKGNLERIDIIDPGFNYLNDPVITITGGNGTNAKAKANIKPTQYTVFFDALEESQLLNTNSNIIGFSTYHKFLSGEEVKYTAGTSSNLPGLINGTNYFVNVKNPLSISLHNTNQDAVVGINSVNITGYSNERHFLTSVVSKRQINSITIENPGENYQTKITTTTPQNVNIVNSTIKIPNHGYKNGELIVHYSSGSIIGGLQSNKSYYVTVIDDDTIKLSNVYADNDLEKDFLYKTKQYVDINSPGSGTLYFDYEPIKVEIRGIIGISSTSEENFGAKLQPIFRGSVDSFYVENKGSNYGTQEILNYVRNPEIIIEQGRRAQATPIISSNGSIQEIIVINQGENYESIPDVIVRSNLGSGAVLTPIIQNNKIVEIKVINGGVNYSNNDIQIDIIPRGQGFKYQTNITSWNVNLYERLTSTNRQSSDGGILVPGESQLFGLEYAHLYLSEFLRDLVYIQTDSGSTFSDLSIDSTPVKRHSPIVGWSYDGNPIYGPYGFTNKISGAVSLVKSGYSKKQSRPNGPSIDIYPLGFFVEDYEYKISNNGDLDEQNGRFCITPEFPNGVYAYFASFDPSDVTKPIFPYVIGNQYESSPIEFNFDLKSNQTEIDINKTKWVRNVHPYNLKSLNSTYKYIKQTNKIKESISKVKYATPGEIQSTDIIFGGNDYKVNDTIVFKNSNTNGKDATADVLKVSGVDVFKVEYQTVSFENEFEFERFGSSLIGFGTGPHGFNTGDVVSIITPIEQISNYEINVSQNILSINSKIEPVISTGAITWFYVSGDLTYPAIRENDYYSVNGEKIQILNVDQENSRVRVLRERFNTVGISTYSVGDKLTEIPRKFKVSIGIQTNYNYKSNYQVYFKKDVVSFGNIGVSSEIQIENKNYESKLIQSPLQTIYLPNHNFETNQDLTYSPLGGPSLRVSVQQNPSNYFSLSNQATLYAVKINENLVGLSTVKVAISTGGDIVKYGQQNEKALVYFDKSSIANYHSFKTNLKGLYTAEVEKNIVEVTTLKNHNLNKNDIIDFNCNPRDEKTYYVLYNDANRVLVLNPRSFFASDVDVPGNTIKIKNHNYKTGEKVLYQSSNPISGLSDNNFYFAVVISEDKISLVNSYFESQQEFPNFIKFNSATNGTISEVNPEIKVIKNQTIIFDLSDSSLSFGAPNPIPAFEFDFYSDNKFQHKYYASPSSTTFDVVKTGSIGIIATNPKVRLKINNDTPSKLFYKLTPTDISNTPSVKRNIIIDTTQINHSEINITESIYTGEHKILDKTNNTFRFQVFKKPENFYSTSNAILKYNTTSKTALGAISECRISNRGTYFSDVPVDTIINSETGFDAVVYAVSDNIGVIKSVETIDVGFDYPTDFSIRPFAQLPTIFRVDPLYSILKVSIVSKGVNYLTAPDLIVIDTKTNNIVDDVLLSYQLQDDFLNIEINTKNLFNRTPRIIPVNNSNGIPIINAVLIENGTTSLTEIDRAGTNNDAIEDEDFLSLQFPDAIRINNSIWSNIPIVRITLGTEYSDIRDFPFDLGDTVFIENIVTFDQSRGGFNSENYDFSYFTVIRRDPKIGGFGAYLDISFVGFLDSTIDEPSETQFFRFDTFLSTAARIVPFKYLPVFETKLVKNEFFEQEKIFSEDNFSVGTITKWDTSNDYLFLDVDPSFNEFKVGQYVVGQTSQTKCIILEIVDYNSRYKIDASSLVNKGWAIEKGFIGNPSQRIHDSDYYQYFSYALSSEVEQTKWDEVVGNVNHTAGFKRFSDLTVNSRPDNSGISTSQDTGNTFGINDIIGNVSVNCYYDFDLVRELVFSVNGVTKSNQIVFNSRILEDYIESISNRVLPIDDISKNFRSDPRDTDFSVINRTDSLQIRSKKYFLFIADRQQLNSTEMLIINSIQDGVDVFLTQYGRVEVADDLGYFEGLLIGNSWNLLYYPTFADFNNYLLDFVALEMTDDPEDIEQEKLGTCVLVENQVFNASVGINSAVTVVGIASTYRASKIQLQVSNENLTEFELNEITVLHDGNGNVSFLEYGELVTNGNLYASEPGIGTYFAEMSPDGNTLEVKFVPKLPLLSDYQFKSIVIGVAKSEFTNTGFLSLEAGDIRSINVSIASSDDPVPTVIGGFDSQYKAVYGFVSVEDTLNNQYRASEVQLISDTSNSYLSEFGILYDPPVGIGASFIGIGTFTSEISGSRTNLLFTPLPNIPVTVNMYQLSVGRF
jgi:hypothetical protein